MDKVIQLNVISSSTEGSSEAVRNGKSIVQCKSCRRNFYTFAVLNKCYECVRNKERYVEVERAARRTVYQ